MSNLILFNSFKRFLLSNRVSYGINSFFHCGRMKGVVRLVSKMPITMTQHRTFYSTNARLKDSKPSDSGKNDNPSDNNSHSNQGNLPPETPIDYPNTTMGRVKSFLRKYGILGMLVYYSVSFGSIFGIFLLLKSGIDVDAVYKTLGIEAGSKDKDKQEASDLEKILIKYLHLDINNPNTPIIIMAILLNKFLMPFRLTAALFLTPRLHKVLARMGIVNK